MLTLIFGIRAWRTTKKAGPDRVKVKLFLLSKSHSQRIGRTPEVPTDDLSI